MRNNERDGITGYLLRDNNTYLNVVEGPTAAVEAMLRRVAKDSRAFDFQIFSLMPTQERQYPAWCMGYHEHAESQVKACPINTFLATPAAQSVGPVLEAMQMLGLRQISNDRRVTQRTASS
ncbi:BLUF domain-containing protein [Epibacterium ulvae]|nr:BLUF domain-containing protein [Epibacterium ulvae]